MFDVFTPVKGLIKLETICIDNNVFRLHYKATFTILMVASLLVTSGQYIGDPIDCIVEEIPNKVCTYIKGSVHLFQDQRDREDQFMSYEENYFI